MKSLYRKITGQEAQDKLRRQVEKLSARCDKLEKSVNSETKRAEGLRNSLASARTDIERERATLIAVRDNLVRFRTVVVMTLRQRAAKCDQAAMDPTMGPGSVASQKAVAEELRSLADGWDS